MDTIVALVVAAVVGLFFVRGYLKSLKKQEEKAREAAARGAVFSEGPKSQHPHIDTAWGIGCGGCTSVCPEGDVLAMIGGKASIVNGHKCIGHGLCAEECPVGAITMVMAKAGARADLPFLTPEYETSIPNLFMAGELVGLALIKNAVNKGRDSVDVIASRATELRSIGGGPEVLDVIIVGAGPAGISASLRAIELGLFRTEE